MSQAERQKVLDLVCSERFIDRSPGEVVATLLDEEIYLASERTIYRILASEKAVVERRNQRRHPEYKRPELVAERPNQVWSWDITRLRAGEPGTWFYLYVVLDLFSRYVVGWMIAEKERADLARKLLEETYTKWKIKPNQLTLHNDRGAPMVAHETTQLLARLGINPSLSRPRISNDNPFSEAQFKTLKYCPEFPGGFEVIEDALAFARKFFAWYNQEHRHAGIAMLTPADVFFGRAEEKISKRNAVLKDAWLKNPERFPRGIPTVPALARKVYINKPAQEELTNSEDDVSQSR